MTMKLLGRLELQVVRDSVTQQRKIVFRNQNGDLIDPADHPELMATLVAGGVTQADLSAALATKANASSLAAKVDTTALNAAISAQHVIDNSAYVHVEDYAAPIGPVLIVPQGIGLGGVATWPAANQYMAMRFYLMAPRNYRYINLQVGVSSGNIQAGVVSLATDINGSITMTRVGNTGVIPCPATGVTRLDLGNFTLVPGDYAVFLWCDNTTATFMNGATAGLAAVRHLLGTTVVGGIPAGSSGTFTNTRWVDISLEAGLSSVYAFGDSIVAGGVSTWFSSTYDPANRFGATNVGVGGNTTAQMLARLTADVTSHSPKYAVVLGGTNDISQAVPYATTISNLAAIYQGITAAGGKIMACTIPPRSAPNSTDPLSSADAAKLLALNAWIRANYSTYPGARLCDWNPVLSTGDGTSPNPTYFNADLTHPNSAGNAVMGTYLRQAMSVWV